MATIPHGHPPFLGTHRAASIAATNAAIAAGSMAYTLGSTILQAEDGAMMTLQGVGAAARFLPTPSTASVEAAVAAAAASAQAAAETLAGAVKKTDLAAANGAAGVGTSLGVPGAVTRTQETANKDVINIRAFTGADPIGTVDSRTAFLAAQTAAVGRTLVAEGTFLIGSPISLESGVTYDFRRAKFIGGAGCSGQAIFWTVGKTDIEVTGGYSEMTAGTPNGTIGTGAYTNFTFFYFENCMRVRVRRASAKRMFTVLNYYNCVDCDGDENYTEDCNASLAAVGDPSGGRTGTACRNVNFRRNIILRGGDDGIALLARGMDVVDCNADENYITKTTRSNGELDGSTLAATGLRAGRFAASGSIIGGGFRRNTGLDMVSDFIRAHDCIDFSVDDNKCNGFAKRSVEACFQIGIGAANGFLRGTVCRNSGKGAVLSGRRVFFCQGMTYGLFEGNSGSASIGGDGTARFDNCSNVMILSNVLANTLAYCIMLSATTNGCTVALNDVSIFSALGIADFNATNRVIDNIGCPTKANGSNIVPAGASARVVSHGIAPTSSAFPRITVQPRGAWGSATKMWVTNITASQFTVNTDQNPTSLDLAFDWFADKT